MLKRTAQTFVRIIGGIVTGLIVVGMLLLWRLAAGPVSFGFLTPHLEDTLNRAVAPFTVSLQDTVLSWEGWRRNLDIQMINLRLADAGGKTLVNVPRASVVLSGRALVAGTVAPQTVEFHHLSLEVTRKADGFWLLDTGDSSLEVSAAEIRKRLMAFLKQERTGDPPLNYLERVAFKNTRLTMRDQAAGRTWQVPSMGLTVERTAEDVHLTSALTLLTQESPPSHLELHAHLALETGEIVGNAAMDHLPTALLADLWPPAAPLKAWNVPASATGAVIMTVNGEIRNVTFDLDSIGPGDIRLPPPFEQEVRISAFRANGRYERATGLWTVPEIFIRFASDTHLLMPPMSHPFPLREISGGLSYQTAESRLDLSGVTLDLAGPRLAVDARLEWTDGQAAMRAAGRLTDVETDRLGVLWPMGWGEKTRNWVLTNISGGRVSEAWAEIEASLGDNGAFDITDISGEIDIDDVTVAYLKPMPSAENVFGRAKFSSDKFEIRIESGKQQTLMVNSGHLVFRGLSKPDQVADIALDLAGPLQDALALADHEPLRLVSRLGLSPQSMSGRLDLRLGLAFPVEESLSHDRVEATAQARLEGVTGADIYQEFDISDGRFDLKVDNEALEIAGEALLGSSPTSLQWRENFSETAPFKSRYFIKGSFDDAQRRGELGLDFAPFTPDILRGTMATELVATRENDGALVFEANLDLTDMDINLDPLGWRKAAGVAGRAEIIGRSVDGKLQELPKIQIRAADLVVDGALLFDPSGKEVRRISLPRIVYGETDMAASIEAQQSGVWDVTLDGKSFDAWPLIKSLSEKKAEKADSLGSLPQMTLSARLNRVNLVSEHGLNNLTGDLSYDGEKWNRLSLKSEVGVQNAPLLFTLDEAGNKRRLEVTSDDAGAAAQALGLYDNIRDGTLKITGQFHDNLRDRPLSGELNIKEFRVNEAPGLVRLVSLVSLTGVLEALQDPDGLNFAKLNAPYLFRDGILEIKKAHVTGLSLGLTANGTLDTRRDQINLRGTLVPAYVLNSLLGGLPLVGKLLSGGEEGGGVFAASYRVEGSTEDPEISVNTLSTLAPGVLRNLFGIFSGAPSSEQSPPPTQEEGEDGSSDEPPAETTIR